MKRALALAASLALAFTMSACGTATGIAGTWGNGYNTDKQPYLELTPGLEEAGNTAGYLKGSDGCNRLSGTWELKSGDLKFLQLNAMGATQLLCDGHDSWLSKAAGGTIKGNTLTLTDAQGAPVGTLQRRN